VKHLSGAPLYGRPLALPTNNRLGWKGLPRTNTLAYCENQSNTAVKSFVGLIPGGIVIKLCTAVSYDFFNKLERLSQVSLSSLV
jgi:hypothetical protein